MIDDHSLSLDVLDERRDDMRSEAAAVPCIMPSVLLSAPWLRQTEELEPLEASLLLLVVLLLV